MTIKLNRARSLSAIGCHPRTFDAFVKSIPASVVGTLTAPQLAALLDAMHQVSQKSKQLAEQEALSNGGIWDGSSGSFRALAT